MQDPPAAGPGGTPLADLATRSPSRKEAPKLEEATEQASVTVRPGCYICYIVEGIKKRHMANLGYDFNIGIWGRKIKKK